jgi:DNA polymerase III epsilon subunit family exonuclease
MTNWTRLDYGVADVEGNGQQTPDLVELAVVRISSGVIGEPSSWLVKPDEPIKHFATRIHGLTGADVAGAPKFADIAEQVRRVLDVQALVAHNAHVDVGVLSRKLDRWQPPEVFDTLRLARRLLPGRASYRLGALVDALHLADGLPDGLAPHRATYDALVTARLFILLATRATTLEDLRGKPPERTDGDAQALF